MASTDDYSGALAVFRMIAQEFSDIPDEDEMDDDGNVTTYGVLSYMSVFATLISRKRYGEHYNTALAYLTAHKLLMMGYGSGSDSSGLGSIADSFRISSASEGETSVSFSDNTTSDDEDSEYTLTIYGRMFLSIKRSVIVPIVSAGEPVIPPLRRR